MARRGQLSVAFENVFSFILIQIRSTFSLFRPLCAHTHFHKQTHSHPNDQSFVFIVKICLICWHAISMSQNFSIYLRYEIQFEYFLCVHSERLRANEPEREPLSERERNKRARTRQTNRVVLERTRTITKPTY